MRHVISAARRAQRVELILPRLLRKRIAGGTDRGHNQHGRANMIQSESLEHHGHCTPLRCPSPSDPNRSPGAR
jgi:hypothetical protein